MSFEDPTYNAHELKDRLDELEDCEGDELTGADREELAELRELDDELGGTLGDEQIIEERDFEDYARELAEDIGAIPEGYSWPTSCIDWDRAARELRMDYTEIEFRGRTYLVRL